MKSVASRSLQLVAVSSALFILLILQPISCHREPQHHRDHGNENSMKSLHHHKKNHSHDENVHKKLHTDEKHRKHTDPLPMVLEVVHHQPLGYIPVCSWCHSVNFDPDRVPKILPIASCCGGDRPINITGVTDRLVDIRCETIYYDLLVQMKSKDQTMEDKWLKVPAGCTPALPDLQDTDQASTKTLHSAN